MIVRPPRINAAKWLLFATGLVGVSVLLWVWNFVLREWSLIDGGVGRLSIGAAADCLQLWRPGRCAAHLYEIGAAPVRNLFRLQSFTVAPAITAVFAIGFVAYERLFQVHPITIKAGQTVMGMPDLLKAARDEKLSAQEGLHWFNGWRLALEREVRHTLIFGAIGGGKTQAMAPLLKAAIERQDKVLVLDIKGDFTRSLPSTTIGDRKVHPLLIAPQDARSAVWDIAQDLRVVEDAIELAARLIKPATNPFFSDTARAILAMCTIKLMAEKPLKWTWRDLLEETRQPLEELIEIARNYYPGALRFLEADYRQVAATLGTLETQMSALRMLATAWNDYAGCQRFSVRKWLLYKTEQRTVILQRSGRFSDLSDGWISAFLSVASSTVSDPELSDAPHRRIWFFLDEFAQLPKVHNFSSFLDIGRSKGICVVLGVQDIAQIREKYGREKAELWMSIVGTKIAAKINAGPTAQRLESDIGQTTVIYRRLEPTGNGSMRWHIEERQEYPFLRSEFETELGPRKHGVEVLVLGIGKDVYKVTIPYTTFENLRPAQASADWTTRFRLDPRAGEKPQEQAEPGNDDLPDGHGDDEQAGLKSPAEKSSDVDLFG